MYKTFRTSILCGVALLAHANRAHAASADEPGGGIGLASGAQLAEGLYVSEQNSYGSVNAGGGRTGINIPVLIYSTPYTFSDTRLEFLFQGPFAETFGAPKHSGTTATMLPMGFAPILAHNFGNGLNISLTAQVRAPSVDALRNYTAADFYSVMTYLKDGINITTFFIYSGTFGSHKGTPIGSEALAAASGVTGASDAVDVDFTASKKFGKVELGVVGFAQTAINTRLDDVGFRADGSTYSRRPGSVAIGGLIGYAFGKFNVQAYATREVAKRFDYVGTDAQGNSGNGPKETRGWIRVSLPIYLASDASSPASVQLPR